MTICSAHIEIDHNFRRAKRQVARIKRQLIFYGKYEYGVDWALHNQRQIITRRHLDVLACH